MTWIASVSEEEKEFYELNQLHVHTCECVRSGQYYHVYSCSCLMLKIYVSEPTSLFPISQLYLIGTLFHNKFFSFIPLLIVPLHFVVSAVD